MSKRKYNKQLREGNTNMSYEMWKLWNTLLRNNNIEYSESWYEK